MTRSANPRMLIVGAIILFCIIFTFMGNDLDVNTFLNTNTIVLLLVGCVLGYACSRRFPGARGNDTPDDRSSDFLIQPGVVLMDSDVESGGGVPVGVPIPNQKL